MISELSSHELNNNMFQLIHISSQESLLLKSFEQFYENLDCYNDLIAIINSQTKVNKFKISIRLIDYFVTKYSKKNKISYKLNDNKNTNEYIQFSIYQSYKQQLKLFQKKNFDPFARGTRIPYFINNNCIITTIGQLNFFKWFISKKIMDYVIKNKEAIELEINKSNKNKLVPKVKEMFKSYKKIEIKHIPINNKMNILKNKTNILVTF